MVKIGIVYFTGGGSTKLLADAVAHGARSVAGAEAELHRIEGSHIVQGKWQDAATLDALTACDVIAFGAPTYMGGPAAQFKAFADGTAFHWRARRWKGKLAAGFTISGNPSGDKLNTLSYFNTLAGQHGMLWLNWDEMPRQPDGTNHLGSYTGLMAQNPPPPGSEPVLGSADALSAQTFGRYVAATAVRLLARPLS
jgi:NAD(P)H dehydrogenase (quinone)